MGRLPKPYLTLGMVWLKSTTTNVIDTSNDTSTDVTIVAKDGVVELNKLILMHSVPGIFSLMCEFCSKNHEPVKIIIEDVAKNDIEEALKADFCHKDGSNLAEVFGF